MRAYFGEDAPTLPIRGFRGVFEAVADGRAIAGVVPIENLVNGTVRENYDLLLEFALEIRGEVVVPVRLCLAALPGQTLDEIERVYSHVQALGQADAFLRTRPWTLLTTYNTAGAGKAIVERGGAGRGGRPLAACRGRSSGWTILADGIQGDPDNRTRFLVIAPPEAPLPAAQPTAVDPSGAARTTLVIGIRNEPGALLRAMTRLRRPRPEHVEAREPASPRSALGVRLLGRPRRRRDGARHAGGARRPGRRHDLGAGPGQLRAGRSRVAAPDARSPDARSSDRDDAAIPGRDLDWCRRPGGRPVLPCTTRSTHMSLRSRSLAVIRRPVARHRRRCLLGRRDALASAGCRGSHVHRAPGVERRDARTHGARPGDRAAPTTSLPSATP